MSPEKQRIAIAEACGAVWKRQSCSPWYPDDETRNVYFRRLYFIQPDDIRGTAILPDARGDEMVADDHPVPDYLNDLNAMHEAEKTITDLATLERYRNLLTAICFEDGEVMWMANAAQRAEAFLRAIGKWEGGE